MATMRASLTQEGSKSLTVILLGRNDGGLAYIVMADCHERAVAVSDVERS